MHWRMAIAGVFVMAPLVCGAGNYEVDQKDRQFSVKSLSVRVGDVVSFKNNDPFFHNIFSLSDAKTFDLGSFPQGQSRAVTFDSPGTVQVECGIHPEMKMTITVTK